jgi:hypothetical protein
MLTNKGWSRHFDDAIPLPDGGEIETLREAANFIIALPEREHSLPHWQTAMRLLIDAAEHGGIVMMADIAMRRALSHGQPRPEPGPRKKAATDHSTIETVDGDECSGAFSGLWCVNRSRICRYRLRHQGRSVGRQCRIGEGADFEAHGLAN